MTKSDFQIQHTCYTHVKSCVYLCIVQGSTLLNSHHRAFHESIRKLETAMETVEFEKHDIIIRQAAIGNKLYIIESGEVAAWSQNKHSHKTSMVTKKILSQNKQTRSISKNASNFTRCVVFATFGIMSLDVYIDEELQDVVRTLSEGWK